MTRPYILGVDPGLNGGFSILDTRSRKIIFSDNFPLRNGRTKSPRSKKIRRIIDPYTFSLKLSKFSNDISTSFIEEVGVMTGHEGTVSMFRFGESFGTVIGVVSSFLIPTVFCQPAAWKGALNLNREKSKSLEVASQIFPDAAHLWPLKKHDGRAESALIAEFGRRTLETIGGKIRNS